MRACPSAVAHPWLATLAACIEFTPHPSNKTAVFYSNLPERVDSLSGDLENLPVTKHVEEEEEEEEEEEWKDEVKMVAT